MKFICPYCYEEHDSEKLKMKCSYNVVNAAYAMVTCKFGHPKDAEGFIDPKYVKQCMKCTYAKKDVYCPNTKNESVIPQRCIVSKNLPIALLGAKESGKSHYIGVLVNEIRKRMSRSFNCSINMNTDPVSKQTYDDVYYNPLFKLKQTIRFTDKGEIPPLIFPIDFDNGKRVTLTFYDTAGENLDSEETMLQYNKYIPNSKGIILLLDPLQVPTIREKLEGKVPLPSINNDIYDILDRIIINIENVTNNRKQFDIPLALAFTKIDALEAFNDILPENSCLRVESEYVDRGAFVKREFESTDIAMRDIVDNMIDSALEQKMKRFKHFAFFGLTALGGVPNGATLAGDGVNPRRVLDPLLWLLAENNYIKTVK